MSIASLATLSPDSIARRRLRLLAGWAAALVLYMVLQFGMTEPGSFRAAALIDLAWTLASLLAAAQCYLTATRFRGRERLAWLGFAGAGLIWLAGQLYWNYSELVLRQTALFPGWGDIGYLGFPLLAIGGLLISIRRVELRTSFLRPLCNLGVIAVALYTTLGMLLHDSLARTSKDFLYVATAAAYPFLYGTAFLFALTALAIYSEPRKRAIALLQVGALGLLAIAATNWGIGMLGKDYLPGTVAEPIWLCGFALLHWAAWERKNQPTLPEMARVPESQTL